VVGLDWGEFVERIRPFHAFPRHHRQYFMDNLDLEQLAVTATQAIPALETWNCEV